MKISRFLLVGAVLLCSATGLPPASAAAPGWRLDLSKPTGDSTNVTTDGTVRLASEANRAGAASGPRTGSAVYRLPRLREAAAAFTAAVAGAVPDGAELAVDVRGRLPDGQWSEWAEIRPDGPGVLPAAVREVEVRAVLSAPDGVASPELRSLTVTRSSEPAVPSGRFANAGLSYQVFATREGLVGGTTANGHVIAPRDHFVALPSRRGMSANNKGDYSVRVCAANDRCEWAPTWDVGPWNTRDDYWSTPDVRQEWKDLPQGKPAAQAAYQDGYNGGRDQFGRKVANPAGIDLADGTFWDGLQLESNSWVTVTYLWTGSDPAGYVRTSGVPLTVHTGPDATTAAVGIAADHAQVRVECTTTGQQITGSQGTSNVWYRLAAAKFVPAAHVSGGGEAAAC